MPDFTARLARFLRTCCLPALLAAAVFSQSPQTCPAKDREFSPGAVAIVAAEPAELLVGAKVVGKVTRGEVVQVVLVNDQWLFIWEHQGWLHCDDVWTPAEAEQHFDAELKERPTAAAFHNRGVARSAGRRYTEAIADFNAALEFDPKNASALNNRGAAWQKRGELDRALQDFSAAIELAPKTAIVWLNRSAAWADKGEIRKSLDDAKKAVELAPQNPAALNSRGVGWLQSGELEQALSDFEEAIRRAPHFAAAHANRASVESRKGQFAAAIRDYETAIGLDSTSAIHRNDLAWLLATCKDEKFHDAKRALQLAREACAMTLNENWNLLDTLATALSATGDEEAAAAAWQQSLRLAPENKRAALKTKLEAALNATK